MLRVLLAQLPVPNNPSTNVPLAAGYLKAYAHANGLLERVSMTILPRNLVDHAGDAALVDAIVAACPDLLGFSLYTWNSERSLAIAERVRQQLPDLQIVVGGPEVQYDNQWVLAHPAVDYAVVGEGEQTFVALLEALLLHKNILRSAPAHLHTIPGLVLTAAHGQLLHTAERQPLANLAGLPSPYLLGYLELQADDMLMVEVSRWCPYSCSFCLYGRNMGPRLGGRYFPVERLLAEIAWGRERGITRVHFIEANLNLVPPFAALMHALADLNADLHMELYAELRGEHLSDASVHALVQAGLRVAEVGLQTANPAALRVANRRTDLAKWAAGTRRLYAQGVDVLLDVILGLPGDDADGITATRAFIEQEQLGPYDIFILQVLPGTQVRSQADQYQLTYQQRPPYYVLSTDRMDYATLRQLRTILKQEAGIDSHEIEGCPPPHYDIVDRPDQIGLITRTAWNAVHPPAHNRLASHVSLIVSALPGGADWERFTAWLVQALQANPSTLFDLYLRMVETPPAPAFLTTWRTTLPFQPGYLDRVAVFRNTQLHHDYQRISPRIWLCVPWVAQLAPADYAGTAAVIWEYTLTPGEEPPLGAFQRIEGAGILLHGASIEQIQTLRQQLDCRIWTIGER